MEQRILYPSLPRWASAPVVLEELFGSWRGHNCECCNCFRCVALRWLRKPYCRCKRGTHKRELTLDARIRERRWKCICVPRDHPLLQSWCICDFSPTSGNTPSPSPELHIEEEYGDDAHVKVKSLFEKTIVVEDNIHRGATVSEDEKGLKQPRDGVFGCYGIVCVNDSSDYWFYRLREAF